ncbi:uncharacterized protein [Leptinotarsa decemlineata]|uniref:uncharacterized protein n=1 Tax=Leptinotarsa decemlineata TaxID=7539 RepID=UPI003D308760
MPKRAHSDSEIVEKEKKRQKYNKLKRKMEEFLNEIMTFSSDSELSDDNMLNTVFDNSDVEAQQRGLAVTTADVHVDSSDPISLVINEPEQAQADPVNNMNRTEKTLNNDSIPPPPLPESKEDDVMNLFDQDPAKTTKLGHTILDGIAARWSHLLTKGLDREKNKN